MKPIIIGNPDGPAITISHDFWYSIRFREGGKRIKRITDDDAVLPYLNKYFNLLVPATCLRVEG